MKRKICVVTGSRAEYGLLYWLMRDIRDAPQLELQIIATGMHLSPEFGLTFEQIEKDGFRISRKVEMLLSSDSSVGIAKSIGLGISGCADALNELRPDIVLLLGDRFEIFAAACAAMAARIPIAHVHGGELSEGAIDEAIRHAISKMSHLHLTSTEEYRQRVMQLGENPESVFNVGALGLDNIKKLSLLGRDELQKSIAFDLGQRNLLVTFHPVTLEPNTAGTQFTELLAALEEYPDIKVIFTKPNADMEGRVIGQMMDDFVAKHMSTTCVFTNMGQLKYLSALQYVDAVVGNSSSGVIEAPIFQIGTINIGERQRGRTRPDSVIDCSIDRGSIKQAIETVYSKEFQAKLEDVRNPYGDGNASEKIRTILENAQLDSLLKKSFHDLPVR